MTVPNEDYDNKGSLISNKILEDLEESKYDKGIFGDISASETLTPEGTQTM